MPFVDTRAIFLLGAVVCLALSVVLPVAVGTRRLSGDRAWIASTVLLGLGCLLLTLRGMVSPLVTVVLANVLMSAALATAHLAIGRMFGRPQNVYLVMAPVLFVAHWVWNFIDETVAIRALGVAPAVGIQATAIVATVISARRAFVSRAPIIVALGFVVVPLTQWPRGLVAWIRPDLMTDLFHVPLPHAVFMFVAPLSMVVATIGVVLLHRDATEATLHELATRDPLTNLYNRRAFEDAALREEAQARRSGYPLSLLLVDLDHFKRVNDTAGHAAGDALLVAVCRILLDTLRRSDVCGRVGGDEFCALLPATNHEGALRAAERLREAVRATRFDVLAEINPVTLSVGVATLASGRVDSYDALVARADKALYVAKEAGRDRVEAAPEPAESAPPITTGTPATDTEPAT